MPPPSHTRQLPYRRRLFFLIDVRKDVHRQANVSMLGKAWAVLGETSALQSELMNA